MEYEKQYLENNIDWHQSDSIHKAKWISPYIKGEKIAEIGCGSGAILKNLSEKYPEKNFTGFEISKTAYKIFLKSNYQNVQFYNSDFFSKKKKYDQILAIDLIEHLIDPFSFLINLKGYAKDFIFHIPMEFNLLYLLFNKHIDTYNQYGHLHFFDKAFIFILLERSGYKIEKWEFTPIAMIKKDKNLTTKILNFFRSFFYRYNKDLSVKLFGGYSLLCVCK